jgi:UDP-N-acetylmuramoyl-tripeptide--D-alanyl-D-alanine ligase
MKTPIPWTIEEILEATGGALLSASGPDSFPGVGIDSRKIQPGEVFVAIKGDRFDGHDFIDAAVEKKAGCLLIRRDTASRFENRNLEEKGVFVIAVDDTVSALGQMASFLRRKAGIPVVAITGSTGKTTTREMTAAICRRKFETLSTAGNFNNEIGLPLTLFRLAPEHQLAVVELGMNHPGEIRRLSAICSPDIGVITNIGPAHLEGLGDIQSVAMAKGELLENIRLGGVAVLNADDEYSRKVKETAKSRVILFGTRGEAGIRAEDIRIKNETVSFTLVMPEARMDINLNAYGAFMVSNALAAASVARLLEIGMEEIKAGLESFRAVEGRMRIYKTPDGVYVIDDTYNANPMSMEAAIRALTGSTGEKRGILVAGDMLELGDSAKHYHEQIGTIAGSTGVARLYLAGSYAAQVAKGAKAAGMAGSNIFVGTKTDIIADLSEYLREGDWVLVKGSRSTGMEDVVNRLTHDASLCRPASQNAEG